MMRAVTLWISGGLAAATILLCGAALIALNDGGALRLAAVEVLPIAAGYDRAADAVAASSTPTPAGLQRAEALSHAALNQFPYDQAAWLRLAYLDVRQHGELTPAGAADLARSYDLVAIDPVLGPLRVRLALENCPRLSRALLNSVRGEVDALWSNGRARSDLSDMRKTISDPAGRLALALWIDRLSTQPAR